MEEWLTPSVVAGLFGSLFTAGSIYGLIRGELKSLRDGQTKLETWSAGVDQRLEVRPVRADVDKLADRIGYNERGLAEMRGEARAAERRRVTKP